MGSLSIKALVVVLSWLLVVATSAVATTRAWAAVRGHGADTAASMWLSVLAIVPGSGLLVEYVMRLLYADWTGRRPVAPENLMMVVPAAIWLAAGPILFAVSLALLPPRSTPRALRLVRVGHVMAWAFSACATVLSLASV